MVYFTKKHHVVVSKCGCICRQMSLYIWIKPSVLTVVVGDVVGDVDFSIRPLLPQTASGGAGVSVSVRQDSNVSSNQGGLIKVRGCKSNTRVGLNLKYMEQVLKEHFVALLLHYGQCTFVRPPYNFAIEILQARPVIICRSEQHVQHGQVTE